MYVSFCSILCKTIIHEEILRQLDKNIKSKQEETKDSVGRCLFDVKKN